MTSTHINDEQQLNNNSEDNTNKSICSSKNINFDSLGNVPYTERCTVLSSSWQAATLPVASSTLLHNLHRITILYILQEEWAKLDSSKKDELRSKLENCAAALEAISNQAGSRRLRYLLEVSKEPWKHPVLKDIMEGRTPSKENVEQWCRDEGVAGGLERLRQLCAAGSACTGAALRMARALLTLEHSHGARKMALDTLLVLLFKKRDTKTCISEIKALDSKEVISVVGRLSTKDKSSGRLWKHAHDTAVLCAQVTVAACLVKPIQEGELSTLCSQLASLYSKQQDQLSAMLRKLIQPAETSLHIYTVCRAVQHLFADTMRPLICELYIRALTTGMNEFERLKLQDENGEAAKMTSQTLARWFVNLADYLASNKSVSAECILTAFSLHPSKHYYNRVQECSEWMCASKSDKTTEKSLDVKGMVSDVEKAADDINRLALESGPAGLAGTKTLKTFPLFSDGIGVDGSGLAQRLVSGEVLDADSLRLTADACNDLAVLISGPRLKMLTWELSWKDLSSHCLSYMEDTAEGTKTITKELKFVKLDYSQFEYQEPKIHDIYFGIEKGYEHHLEIEEDDDDEEDYWENDEPQKKYRSDSMESENSTNSEKPLLKKSGKMKKKSSKVSELDAETLKAKRESKKEKKKLDQNTKIKCKVKKKKDETGEDLSLKKKSRNNNNTPLNIKIKPLSENTAGTSGTGGIRSYDLSNLEDMKALLKSAPIKKPAKASKTHHTNLVNRVITIAQSTNNSPSCKNVTPLNLAQTPPVSQSSDVNKLVQNSFRNVPSADSHKQPVKKQSPKPSTSQQNSSVSLFRQQMDRYEAWRKMQFDKELSSTTQQLPTKNSLSTAEKSNSSPFENFLQRKNTLENTQWQHDIGKPKVIRNKGVKNVPLVQEFSNKTIEMLSQYPLGKVQQSNFSGSLLQEALEEIKTALDIPSHSVSNSETVSEIEIPASIIMHPNIISSSKPLKRQSKLPLSPTATPEPTRPPVSIPNSNKPTKILEFTDSKIREYEYVSPLKIAKDALQNTSDSINSVTISQKSSSTVSSKQPAKLEQIQKNLLQSCTTKSVSTLTKQLSAKKVSQENTRKDDRFSYKMAEGLPTVNIKIANPNGLKVDDNSSSRSSIKQEVTPMKIEQESDEHAVKSPLFGCQTKLSKNVLSSIKDESTSVTHNTQKSTMERITQFKQKDIINNAVTILKTKMNPPNSPFQEFLNEMKTIVNAGLDPKLSSTEQNFVERINPNIPAEKTKDTPVEVFQSSQPAVKTARNLMLAEILKTDLKKGTVFQTYARKNYSSQMKKQSLVNPSQCDIPQVSSDDNSVILRMPQGNSTQMQCTSQNIPQGDAINISAQELNKISPPSKRTIHKELLKFPIKVSSEGLLENSHNSKSSENKVQKSRRKTPTKPVENLQGTNLKMETPSYWNTAHSKLTTSTSKQPSYEPLPSFSTFSSKYEGARSACNIVPIDFINNMHSTTSLESGNKAQVKSTAPPFVCSLSCSPNTNKMGSLPNTFKTDANTSDKNKSPSHISISTSSSVKDLLHFRKSKNIFQKPSFTQDVVSQRNKPLQTTYQRNDFSDVLDVIEQDLQMTKKSESVSVGTNQNFAIASLRISNNLMEFGKAPQDNFVSNMQRSNWQVPFKNHSQNKIVLDSSLPSERDLDRIDKEKNIIDLVNSDRSTPLIMKESDLSNDILDKIIESSKSTSYKDLPQLPDNILKDLNLCSIPEVNVKPVPYQHSLDDNNFSNATNQEIKPTSSVAKNLSVTQETAYSKNQSYIVINASTSVDGFINLGNITVSKELNDLSPSHSTDVKQMAACDSSLQSVTKMASNNNYNNNKVSENISENVDSESFQNSVIQLNESKTMMDVVNVKKSSNDQIQNLDNFSKITDSLMITGPDDSISRLDTDDSITKFDFDDSIDDFINSSDLHKSANSDAVGNLDQNNFVKDFNTKKFGSNDKIHNTNRDPSTMTPSFVGTVEILHLDNSTVKAKADVLETTSCSNLNLEQNQESFESVDKTKSSINIDNKSEKMTDIVHLDNNTKRRDPNDSIKKSDLDSIQDASLNDSSKNLDSDNVTKDLSIKVEPDNTAKQSDLSDLIENISIKIPDVKDLDQNSTKDLLIHDTLKNVDSDVVTKDLSMNLDPDNTAKQRDLNDLIENISTKIPNVNDLDQNSTKDLLIHDTLKNIDSDVTKDLSINPDNTEKQSDLRNLIENISIKILNVKDLDQSSTKDLCINDSLRNIDSDVVTKDLSINRDPDNTAKQSDLNNLIENISTKIPNVNDLDQNSTKDLCIHDTLKNIDSYVVTKDLSINLDSDNAVKQSDINDLIGNISIKIPNVKDLDQNSAKDLGINNTLKNIDSAKAFELVKADAESCLIKDLSQLEKISSSNVNEKLTECKDHTLVKKDSDADELNNDDCMIVDVTPSNSVKSKVVPIGLCKINENNTIIIKQYGINITTDPKYTVTNISVMDKGAPSAEEKINSLNVITKEQKSITKNVTPRCLQKQPSRKLKNREKDDVIDLVSSDDDETAVRVEKDTALPSGSFIEITKFSKDGVMKRILKQCDVTSKLGEISRSDDIKQVPESVTKVMVPPPPSFIAMIDIPTNISRNTSKRNSRRKKNKGDPYMVISQGLGLTKVPAIPDADLERLKQNCLVQLLNEDFSSYELLSKENEKSLGQDVKTALKRKSLMVESTLHDIQNLSFEFGEVDEYPNKKICGVNHNVETLNKNIGIVESTLQEKLDVNCNKKIVETSIASYCVEDDDVICLSDDSDKGDKKGFGNAEESFKSEKDLKFQSDVNVIISEKFESNTDATNPEKIHVKINTGMKEIDMINPTPNETNQSENIEIVEKTHQSETLDETNQSVNTEISVDINKSENMKTPDKSYQFENVEIPDEINLSEKGDDASPRVKNNDNPNDKDNEETKFKRLPDLLNIEEIAESTATTERSEIPFRHLEKSDLSKKESDNADFICTVSVKNVPEKNSIVVEHTNDIPVLEINGTDSVQESKNDKIDINDDAVLTDIKVENDDFNDTTDVAISSNSSVIPDITQYDPYNNQPDVKRSRDMMNNSGKDKSVSEQNESNTLNDRKLEVVPDSLAVVVSDASNLVMEDIEMTKESLSKDFDKTENFGSLDVPKFSDISLKCDTVVNKTNCIFENKYPVVILNNDIEVTKEIEPRNFDKTEDIDNYLKIHDSSDVDSNSDTVAKQTNCVLPNKRPIGHEILGRAIPVVRLVRLNLAGTSDDDPKVENINTNLVKKHSDSMDESSSLQSIEKEKCHNLELKVVTEKFDRIYEYNARSEQESENQRCTVIKHSKDINDDAIDCKNTQNELECMSQHKDQVLEQTTDEIKGSIVVLPSDELVESLSTDIRIMKDPATSEQGTISNNIQERSESHNMGSVLHDNEYVKDNISHINEVCKEVSQINNIDKEDVSNINDVDKDVIGNENGIGIKDELKKSIISNANIIGSTSKASDEIILIEELRAVSASTPTGHEDCDISKKEAKPKFLAEDFFKFEELLDSEEIQVSDYSADESLEYITFIDTPVVSKNSLKTYSNLRPHKRKKAKVEGSAIRPAKIFKINLPKSSAKDIETTSQIVFDTLSVKEVMKLDCAEFINTAGECDDFTKEDLEIASIEDASYELETKIFLAGLGSVKEESLVMEDARESFYSPIFTEDDDNVSKAMEEDEFFANNLDIVESNMRSKKFRSSERRKNNVFKYDREGFGFRSDRDDSSDLLNGHHGGPAALSDSSNPRLPYTLDTNNSWSQGDDTKSHEDKMKEVIMVQANLENYYNNSATILKRVDQTGRKDMVIPLAENNIQVSLMKNFFGLKTGKSPIKKDASKTEKIHVKEILSLIPGMNDFNHIRIPPQNIVLNVVQVGQHPVSSAQQSPLPGTPTRSNSTNEFIEVASNNSDYGGHNNDDPPRNQDSQIIKEVNNDKSPSSEQLNQSQDNCRTTECPVEANDSSHENDKGENANTTQQSIVQVTSSQETITINSPTTAPSNSVPATNSSLDGQVQLIFTPQSMIQQNFVHSESDEYKTTENNGTESNIPNVIQGATVAATTNFNPVSRAQTLVNILSQKIIRPPVSGSQVQMATFPKGTPINALSLQQALAQILPPPLSQASGDGSQTVGHTTGPQVVHIVQGKAAGQSGGTFSGLLMDNSQQSVVNVSGGTQVLHIVQGKNTMAGSNTTVLGQSQLSGTTFGGLSLVDAGSQQGGNQVLHIVNAGAQSKNSTATAQLLKRVNLLTSLTNSQGNEQKMVQFVCKSADGKSIQLNPQQRGMVLRLQPIETSTSISQKPAETQATTVNIQQVPKKSPTTSEQSQEIKSRSIYEENYAKFIQNSKLSPISTEKSSTMLPKFNQAFGKSIYQESVTKSDTDTHQNQPVTANEQSSELANAISLAQMGQLSSPPLLIRKTQPAGVTQNIVGQVKQGVTPMNIQTMHGGVIYTRQIPVNIGGGQTINLITVPSTELLDEAHIQAIQKQIQEKNNTEQQQNQQQPQQIEQQVIKLVPQQDQSSQQNVNLHVDTASDDANQSFADQQSNSVNSHPLLTQMRIKVPMLSKGGTQMVTGTRVVRPVLQIQRNIIPGTNPQVYQQLVLTTAPALRPPTPAPQQTIRPVRPQTAAAQQESNLSSSTLEQLREFDMVLEQVKERSTVQPGSNSNSAFSESSPRQNIDSEVGVVQTTQPPVSQAPQREVLYSIGPNHTVNVTYVNKNMLSGNPTVLTTSYPQNQETATIVNMGQQNSPQIQIGHSLANSVNNAKPTTPTKVSNKSMKPKSNKPPSSITPSSSKSSPVVPKTSVQKPLEDEQTTQRILYILAEYKEQVENSPDKDKPAPRRRSNPPTNPSTSSKRKKGSSGSSKKGPNGQSMQEMSPLGDDTGHTMGSEDSSCGLSQGECADNSIPGPESQSPQGSPQKVTRKLVFSQEQEVSNPPITTQPQQRNVIIADGQTIAMTRPGPGGKATAVLMPANYLLPMSMVKGGQQITIVTNQGPKVLNVPQGEGGATNTLFLQRLISPAGLKPMLARPGQVRQVRLPANAVQNLQTFNLTAAQNIANNQEGTWISGQQVINNQQPKLVVEYSPTVNITNDNINPDSVKSEASDAQSLKEETLSVSGGSEIATPRHSEASSDDLKNRSSDDGIFSGQTDSTTDDSIQNAIRTRTDPILHHVQVTKTPTNASVNLIQVHSLNPNEPGKIYSVQNPANLGSLIRLAGKTSLGQTFQTINVQGVNQEITKISPDVQECAQNLLLVRKNFDGQYTLTTASAAAESALRDVEMKNTNLNQLQQDLQVDTSPSPGSQQNYGLTHTDQLDESLAKVDGDGTVAWSLSSNSARSVVHSGGESTSPGYVYSADSPSGLVHQAEQTDVSLRESEQDRRILRHEYSPDGGSPAPSTPRHLYHKMFISSPDKTDHHTIQDHLKKDDHSQSSGITLHSSNSPSFTIHHPHGTHQLTAGGPSSSGSSSNSAHHNNHHQTGTGSISANQQSSGHHHAIRLGGDLRTPHHVLRHKYALMEHELRLQKSLSEECEDLGVDSPSASDLFPEADLLFTNSPSSQFDHSQDGQMSSVVGGSTNNISSLGNVGNSNNTNVSISSLSALHSGTTVPITGVSLGLKEDNPMDEEFARMHPNTTFHSGEIDILEDQDDLTFRGTPKRSVARTTSGRRNEIVRSVIEGVGSSGIPSIYQPNKVSTHFSLVSMPKRTINIMSLQSSDDNSEGAEDSMNSAESKDGLVNNKHLDGILNSNITRDVNLNTSDSPGCISSNIIQRNVTQVIRHASNEQLLSEKDSIKLCTDENSSGPQNGRSFLLENSSDVRQGDSMILKSLMMERDGRDGLTCSSPEQHSELFWESNSNSNQSDEPMAHGSTNLLDFSSEDSNKCCKSPPSCEETNSTDSSSIGGMNLNPDKPLRLNSVIKSSGSTSTVADGPILHSALTSNMPATVQDSRKLDFNLHKSDSNTSTSPDGECIDIGTRRSWGRSLKSSGVRRVLSPRSLSTEINMGAEIETSSSEGVSILTKSGPAVIHSGSSTPEDSTVVGRRASLRGSNHAKRSCHCCPPPSPPTHSGNASSSSVTGQVMTSLTSTAHTSITGSSNMGSTTSQLRGRNRRRSHVSNH